MDVKPALDGLPTIEAPESGGDFIGTDTPTNTSHGPSASKTGFANPGVCELIAPQN